MKMKSLFSFFLVTLCCGGMLIANPKMEEGERIHVTTTENIDEAIATQEERALRALELAEVGGEHSQVMAVETAPVEESTVASRAAANASFGIESISVVNKMSQASGLSYISYPGAYHNLIRFLSNEVRLEDGSWWKIYTGDYSETANWLTESSLSFLDVALGLTPDTVVITANGDWPLYSTYRYHLTNQQTGKYVRANLNDFYSVTETRYIYSSIWLYDAFGNLYVQLTLNDGSIWNTLPVDTQCFSWSNGDIIVVGVNTDQYAAYAPYMLINVRTNDNGGASCVLYYN